VLSDYIKAAMHHATYEILGDGTFYGEIPNFQGVWGNAETLEACREELQSALEDWMLVRIGDRSCLPIVDGINLNQPQPEVA